MFRSVSSVAIAVGSTIISFIVSILIIFNVFSGIVGGIWLAIKGGWGSIALGFILGFVMPWAWTLASLPSMGFAALAALVADKGSRAFTAIFGFLGYFYSSILVSLWVFYVFALFIGRASSDTYIPHLLWSYSTIMSPLSYMARQEPPDSTGTSLGLLFAQLSFLLCTVFWFFGTHPNTIVITFLCLILAFTLFVVILAVTQIPARHKRTFLGFIDKIPHWLRWLLVLPTAFIADWASQSISLIIATIIGLRGPYANAFIWFTLAPVIWLIVGVRFAPTHRSFVGAILAVIKVVVLLYNSYSAIDRLNHGGTWNDIYPITEAPLWWHLITYILGIIILMVFYGLIRRSERVKAKYSDI
jgi:hypothetical protein